MGNIIEIKQWSKLAQKAIFQLERIKSDEKLIIWVSVSVKKKGKILFASWVRKT